MTKTDSNKRPYHHGRCDDCGRWGQVTSITIALDGYRMEVCRACFRVFASTIAPRADAYSADFDSDLCLCGHERGEHDGHCTASCSCPGFVE